MEIMPRFARQIAIITGGTSGIGLAVARRLRTEGATVAILDFDAVALQHGAGEAGPNDLFLCVDITDEEQVRSTIASVVERLGRIDILVNSAGVTGQTNLKSHEVTLADFDRVLRTNLYGTFLMTKHVLPVMTAQGYGRILNLASIAGKEGNAGMVAYSSSKAAVIGLTKVQGKEYAETGVTINALAPAVIQTPLVDAMPPAQVKYMTDKIPMKRCGTLDEVAAMAAFIVSREAGFTTGFTFDLTGGRAVY
jgi:2-dehydro-3-deoxy-L-rhamnonate dehydrogenase (NAD+)